MTNASPVQTEQDSMCLDQDMIDSLSGIMSPSAMRSLLVDMERDVRQRLDRLSEVQVASGSLALIAQDAHDLKSMGGNFGLIEMSVRAGVVERAARNEDIESVRASLPPLLSMGWQSLDALSKRPEFDEGRAS